MRLLTVNPSVFGMSCRRVAAWPAPSALQTPAISSTFDSDSSATRTRFRYAHSAANDEASPVPAPKKPSFFSFLDREATIAPPGYNRLASVPYSFLIQLSIGSVYAWSIFNAPLTREIGVITAAADDWNLGAVLPIFSVCATTLGLTTAILGPWAERSGPRKVAAAAAVGWGGGLLLTSVGTAYHFLPACYVGYGLLGGLAWGLGYIAPVSNLMKWFPDRRGLATGLALTAFGGGAMLATPINEALFQLYFEMPTYLGAAEAVDLVTEHGRRFATVGGELQEVVVATANDVNALGYDGVAPGVYVCGTGNTGAAKTFATLGFGYFAAMAAGAAGQRVPAADWKPEGWEPPTEQTNAMITQGNVHHDTALRTPQFYLLWAAVAGNAIAGVTMMSCAKTIMSDVFGAALPAIVTGGFAAGYVAALSGVNMLGRFGWAAASDYLGRKNTYYVFGLGVPILACLPSITTALVDNPNPVPLYMFIGGTSLVVSFYAGLFSVLPAYLADLYGQKHVGAIHGRQLTAWSAAALGGPMLLSTLRDSSYKSAVSDLASSVSPEAFKAKFGAGIEQLQTLVDTKTVTIAHLMDVVPPGTLDPTPCLYNSTLYTMSGLLAAAFVCNSLIKPVDPKFHLEQQDKAAVPRP